MGYHSDGGVRGNTPTDRPPRRGFRGPPAEIGQLGLQGPEWRSGGRSGLGRGQSWAAQPKIDQERHNGMNS